MNPSRSFNISQETRELKGTLLVVVSLAVVIGCAALVVFSIYNIYFSSV